MDDSVAVLVKLLRETFGSDFKAYYNGEPDLIPDFNLPCVVVTKSSDQTGLGATGFDRMTEELVIKVVLNKADDVTASSTDEVELTEYRVRQLVEGRAANGDYLAKTIKGVLRHNMMLNGRRIGRDVRFEIGSLVRPGDVITTEGHVQISMTSDIMVVNRS